MIRRTRPFIAWLAAAAAVDWLVSRTLARSAIFMPKSPPVTAIYQGLALAGQLAFTLAGVLALAGLGWLIGQAARQRRFVLGASLAGLLALGLATLVIPPAGWLPVIYRWFTLLAIALIAGNIWRAVDGWSHRLARTIPALALGVGALHQAREALHAVMPLPGSPPGLALFYAGEALVVASGFCFWWMARQRGYPRGVWLAAALPALAFSAMALANPSITGIMAIWSTGLTLYLPWPLYAASLYLATVAAIGALRRGDPAGWAILLLAAGGFPPQLSTQVALGVIGLWLMAAPSPSKEQASHHEAGERSAPAHLSPA